MLNKRHWYSMLDRGFAQSVTLCVLKIRCVQRFAQNFALFLALVTSRDHVMYGDPYTYPPPSINTMNRRPGGGLGPAWTPFSGGFFIPRHVATLYQGPHLRSCGPAPCPERPAQCHHSRPAEGAACGRAFAVTFWCARPGHVQGTARALPPDRSPAWA